MPNPVIHPARHRRHADATDAAPVRSAPRRLGHAVGEVVQTLLALAGLGAIVLVVLALTMHVTLIMFKTGSMSPTIPAGSVAAVQRVPASAVQVGDVVTVDRPGELPVTHRIIAIAVPDGSTSPATRSLTLRGDANVDPDPAPYLVDSVRIVRWSVPGVAHLIVGLSRPWVMAATTVGATALVTWAFWPRRRPEPGPGTKDPDEEPV